MRTYIKRDLVNLVSEATGKPMEEVEPVVMATLQAYVDLMKSADTECRIEVRGFGVFTVKETKAKPKARNLHTGETIYVPPHRKVHFKPCKSLKRFLRQPLEVL